MSILLSVLQLLLSSSFLLLSHSSASSISQANVWQVRGQHLKKHCNTNNIIQTPLYPRDHGEYVFSLGFGTPPQPLTFSIDTASSLSWFPCTHNYTCTKCNSTYVDTAHIPTFIPESSSSYKPFSCQSPQCKTGFQNPKCNDNTTAGSCVYKIPYGSDNTKGQLVSETLTVGGGGLSVDNFIIGCSLSSTNMPEGGIMGFGRSRESLPSQLGLKSFSYCLVSYDNPNPNASSDLVLTTTNTSMSSRNKGGILQHTPFLNNPNDSSIPPWRLTTLKGLYYVWLQNISMGGVDVKVPDEYLVLHAKGNGGTIVDTDSTFTWMEKPVFDLVFNEFRKQVGEKLDIAIEFKNPLGIEQCYNVSRVATTCKKKLPQLTFRFAGGAKMVVPMAKYFMDNSVLCICVEGTEGYDHWPAIILGNYQQQDHYMEFDLENNCLGIRPQKCG